MLDKDDIIFAASAQAIIFALLEWLNKLTLASTVLTLFLAAMLMMYLLDTSSSKYKD